MGWRPLEVYSVSVSEFWAAWAGWSKYHSAPAPDLMTREELDGYLRDWDPNG